MNEFIPTLTITDGLLECRQEPDAIAWSTRAEDLVLIAEYTSNMGRTVAYFVVFIFMDEGSLMFAEFPAGEDTEAVLQVLAERLRAPIALGLLESKTWASRVIWPPQLADQEYFTYTETPQHSFTAKLRRMLRGAQYNYEPTDAAWNYIHAEEARHGQGLLGS